MKRFCFIFCLILLIFSLTSCNSNVSINDEAKLKELIQNKIAFDNNIEYICINSHNSDYAILEDNCFKMSFKQDEIIKKYEYNLNTNELYCDNTLVENTKCDNLDIFAKEVCKLNGEECLTINDYWMFIRNKFLNAKSFKVTTYRGEGRYYYFSIPASEFINYDKFEVLKKGLNNTEFNENSEIKISLLVNLEKGQIFSKFELSVKDKNIIAFY